MKVQALGVVVGMGSPGADGILGILPRPHPYTQLPSQHPTSQAPKPSQSSASRQLAAQPR
jgi:hypothetical protein